MVGFGGGIVVWGVVYLVGVLFDFCLIIYIYFMTCIGEFVGGISEFRVVSIALFTWCFCCGVWMNRVGGSADKIINYFV